MQKDPDNPANYDQMQSARNLSLQGHLIIKSLLEICMRSHNRVISAESTQLRDFFVILERIFTHGLKRTEYRAHASFLNISIGGDLTTTSTLESQGSLAWKMIEKVSKVKDFAEFGESVSCIQQLPTLSSRVCRLRGWFRLLLMQKKLSDHFTWLIEQSELLQEFYESWAFLLTESTVVSFSGSLVGLRVLECNLYLKQQELEAQPSEIDLSLYVKLPTVSMDEEEEENIKNGECSEGNSQKMLLDQNNYLEERNRFLYTRTDKLQAELYALKKSVSTPESEMGEDLLSAESFRLHEMETAMTLMEKDVHEKQDTIALLRKQIDDIKQINLDLYQKLRNMEDQSRQKDKSISNLEKTCNDLSERTQDLGAQVASFKSDINKQGQLNEVLKLELQKKSEFSATLQSDLANLHSQNQVLTESKAAEALLKEDLLVRISALQNTERHYLDLQAENLDLKSKVEAYEETLKEMGVHLEKTKLKAEDLKESAVLLADAQWESDKHASVCKNCEKDFSVSRRKHHCRNCGGIFCNQCSANTMPLPSSAKPVWKYILSCHEKVSRVDSEEADFLHSLESVMNGSNK